MHVPRREHAFDMRASDSHNRVGGQVFCSVMVTCVWCPGLHWATLLESFRASSSDESKQLTQTLTGVLSWAWRGLCIVNRRCFPWQTIPSHLSPPSRNSAGAAIFLNDLPPRCNATSGDGVHGGELHPRDKPNLSIMVINCAVANPNKSNSSQRRDYRR